MKPCQLRGITSRQSDCRLLVSVTIVVQGQSHLTWADLGSLLFICFQYVHKAQTLMVFNRCRREMCVWQRHKVTSRCLPDGKGRALRCYHWNNASDLGGFCDISIYPKWESCKWHMMGNILKDCLRCSGWPCEIKLQEIWLCHFVKLSCSNWLCGQVLPA